MPGPKSTERYFTIECYIKVDVEKPEIYPNRETAEQDARSLQLMQPENLYIVKEFEHE